MAIKFDKNYNQKISKEIKLFNQKVRRARGRGLTHIPETISVKKYKTRFSSRKELNEDLRKLREFRTERGVEVIENLGGARTTRWEMDYLKSLEQEAKEHFDELIEDTKKQDVVNDIGNRMYLEGLERKRDFLDKDIELLNQNDYNTYKRTIENYVDFNWHNERSFRGFLSEVEQVMTLCGVNSKDIDEFMEKFKVLTPRQFFAMYRESKLIGKVFDLADSPEYTGGLKLNTDLDDAKKQINNLLKQADDLVAKYKEL